LVLLEAEVVGSDTVSTLNKRLIDQIKNLMKSTPRHSLQFTVTRKAKDIAHSSLVIRGQ